MTGSARFTGRSVLVTGGSSGIGRAVAIRFAAEGAHVAINGGAPGPMLDEAVALARQAARDAGHADALIEATPGDVSRESDAEGMIDRAATAFGRLDILINNAGIQREAATHDLEMADFDRVLAVNLTGAALMARAAIRHFLSRPGGGTIVNCSSVHQIIPKPGYLAYSLSKGAMGNLTRTLALEYADRGIRVNAVAPGAIETPMNEAWTSDPDRRAAVERHIPLGRAGSPEEMASVFAFLASDEAAYVTGQTIYACGGLTLFNDFRLNWSS